MQPPDGEVFHLSEFWEVDPAVRLSYTFRLDEPDPDDQESVVTLTLRDLGDGPNGPRLEHRSDRRTACAHEQGGTDSFERLGQVVSSRA